MLACLSIFAEGNFTLGSLGAAAVLAVVMDPVLDSATTAPWSLATAVAVAPPAFDLMLVAAIAGIAALRGVSMGSRWALLVCGLLAFTAADVNYGLQVTSGTYLLGTPLDAGWAAGLALMTTWVDGVTPDRRTATRVTRPPTRFTALAVSSVATIAGLGVLVVGTQVPLSPLAVTLAGVTLLAAAARSELAVRLLARMADQRQLAATNGFTGLPNRRALYAGGDTRLAEPQHRRQALLMLDLDKFKDVNDTLGHHAGDQLLVQVSGRLRNSLRSDDVLARLGGDEFAVLIEDAGHDEAVNAATRLCAAVAAPYLVEGVLLLSSVIGILFPENGLDLSDLLRKADIAMYKAKALDKGHHVYCIADDADHAAALEMVDERRVTLAGDQRGLHHQLTDTPDTGRVIMWALVR